MITLTIKFDSINVDITAMKKKKILFYVIDLIDYNIYYFT